MTDADDDESSVISDITFNTESFVDNEVASSKEESETPTYCEPTSPVCSPEELQTIRKRERALQLRTDCHRYWRQSCDAFQEVILWWGRFEDRLKEIRIAALQTKDPRQSFEQMRLTLAAKNDPLLLYYKELKYLKMELSELKCNRQTALIDLETLEGSRPTLPEMADFLLPTFSPLGNQLFSTNTVRHVP